MQRGWMSKREVTDLLLIGPVMVMIGLGPSTEVNNYSDQGATKWLY